jgi:hypothetical protein
MPRKPSLISLYLSTLAKLFVAKTTHTKWEEGEIGQNYLNGLNSKHQATSFLIASAKGPITTTTIVYLL